jgi:hypothetical protein
VNVSLSFVDEWALRKLAIRLSGGDFAITPHYDEVAALGKVLGFAMHDLLGKNKEQKHEVLWPRERYPRMNVGW